MSPELLLSIIKNKNDNINDLDLLKTNIIINKNDNINNLDLLKTNIYSLGIIII